jgi:peroxiredoxin
MRKSIAPFALAAALLVLDSCNKDPGPIVGQPAPEFTLPTLDGSSKNLADYRGQVVVLNFWATWCPPCIQEMPSLERLHEALANKGVAVIAVSVDERYSDIVEFVDTYRVTFDVLHDEGKKLSRKYQTFKYPETYILDRAGRLKSKVIGPRDWAAPSVIRDMVELLKEAPPVEPTEPIESMDKASQTPTEE